jgi:hypothetical protein
VLPLLASVLRDKKVKVRDIISCDKYVECGRT